MQEQIFNAKEKKVSRMSRDGLMEENLATKERRKLTDRESEVSFKKSDAEQSFVSGNDDKKQSFGTEPTTYNTWNVYQGGKIEFEFEGKVNGISAKWADKQELFTIAYTIEPGEIYGPNSKV